MKFFAFVFAVFLLTSLASTAIADSSGAPEGGVLDGGGAQDMLNWTGASPNEPSRAARARRDETRCKTSSGDILHKGDPGFEDCVQKDDPQALLNAAGDQNGSATRAGVRLHF